MSDISDAVQSGVNAYAEAETALRAAHDALLKLPATYEAVRLAGVEPPVNVKPYGYLESQKRGAIARKLAGRVADILSDVIETHQDDTWRAQELGIDIQPPPGVVVPMGGGR